MTTSQATGRVPQVVVPRDRNRSRSVGSRVRTEHYARGRVLGVLVELVPAAA